MFKFVQLMTIKIHYNIVINMNLNISVIITIVYTRIKKIFSNAYLYQF